MWTQMISGVVWTVVQHHIGKRNFEGGGGGVSVLWLLNNHVRFFESLSYFDGILQKGPYLGPFGRIPSIWRVSSQLSTSGAQARKCQENLDNTMAVDDLAQCVERSSTPNA